jgi:hypothetical protein
MTHLHNLPVMLHPLYIVPIFFHLVVFFTHYYGHQKWFVNGRLGGGEFGTLRLATLSRLSRIEEMPRKFKFL